MITTALAALAGTFAPGPAPALAEEVAYTSHDVRSRPRTGTPEHVTLDVPATWERDRLNRYSVGFFDYTEHPSSIVVDLDPLSDTVREVRAEVRTLRALGRRYYREHDFRVNGPDKKIRARWVFAYRDAQTEDTWSYTSVFLIDGDRLTVDGRRAERDELKEIRLHVVRSYEVVD
jgi:hypothetical protein